MVRGAGVAAAAPGSSRSGCPGSADAQAPPRPLIASNDVFGVLGVGMTDVQEAGAVPVGVYGATRHKIRRESR
jgi:hypothetical protein